MLERLVWLEPIGSSGEVAAQIDSEVKSVCIGSPPDASEQDSFSRRANGIASTSCKSLGYESSWTVHSGEFLPAGKRRWVSQRLIVTHCGPSSRNLGQCVHYVNDSSGPCLPLLVRCFNSSVLGDYSKQLTSCEIGRDFAGFLEETDPPHCFEVQLRFEFHRESFPRCSFVLAFASLSSQLSLSGIELQKGYSYCFPSC